MKKIILFAVLGILVIFLGVRLLAKPKRPSGTPSVRTGSKKTGKTTGQIKAKTAEEIAAEKRKARKEERERRKELRRRQREERRAQRMASRYGYSQNRLRIRGRRGGMSTARGRKSSATLYQLRAIIIIDNTNYALIDNRQVQKGDDIMGRKIVDILSDRIVIDDAGKFREIKIGEMVFPNLMTQSKRTRR